MSLKQAVLELEKIGATEHDVDRVASLWHLNNMYRTEDGAFTVVRTQ